MDKKEHNIDEIFDKEFDLFLQENIKNEFNATKAVRERIKKRVEESIEKESDIGMNIVSMDIKEDENRRALDMKNKKRNKALKIVAASIALVLIVGNIGSLGVYGKDMFTLIKEVSTGNITMIEEKFDGDINEISQKVPEQLKGQIFDKNGKEVEYLTPELEGKIYTKDGKLIVGFTTIEDTGKMEICTEESMENDLVKYNSIESAAKDLKFKPMTIPGFKVEQVSLYKDDKGKASDEAVEMILSKDNIKIYVQQRFSSKDNSYVGGGKNVKEVSINGEKGILSDGDSLDWEYKDKLIGVHVRDGKISEDRLVDICSSMEEIK